MRKKQYFPINLSEFEDYRNLCRVLMTGAYDDPEHPSKLRARGFGWSLYWTDEFVVLEFRSYFKRNWRSFRDCMIKAGFTKELHVFFAEVWMPWFEKRRPHLYPAEASVFKAGGTVEDAAGNHIGYILGADFAFGMDKSVMMLGSKLIYEEADKNRNFFNKEALEEIFAAPQVNFRHAYGRNVWEQEAMKVIFPPPSFWIHAICLIEDNKENEDSLD